MKVFTLNTLAVSSALALAAFALAVPAHAQVGVYIGSAPPPLRYEVRPAIPGPGYAWSEGYWEPYGGRYRWHGGAWQRPPFEGGYYVHPHYDHYDQGWRIHEGYWSHENHEGYQFNHR